MIDPTTMDFNTFRNASGPSNSTSPSNSNLASILMIFGLVAITIGLKLYLENYYSRQTNE
jgi:hypothetical protein